jgi:hypothetical protein
MKKSTHHLYQKSHVCLVWLKPSSQDVISDPKKSEINEALLRWELGGHSVSIWMLDPGFDDVNGIEAQGFPRRVFDIRMVLNIYKYNEAFEKDGHLLFLKIDTLKFLIPLYILQYGLSNKNFEHCIACDLDVGTRDGGVTDEYKVFDLKYIYDHDTNEKLDKMGVVFAEGADGSDLDYENSFAIFRNDNCVLNSLFTFVDFLMSLNDHRIVPSNETVWGWIPTFVQHLKGVRYGGVVKHGLFPTYEKQDLKLLFNGPHPSKYVSGNESQYIENLLKRIPVPMSKFAGGRDTQVPGRTPYLLALGLAALTFTMSFVPRS